MREPQSECRGSDNNCRHTKGDASPITVVADDRERGAGVIECLRGRPEFRVFVRRLDLGDYLVDNRVLIERKTVTDLAVSIADGRLFTQAIRMAGARYSSVVAIEGPEDGTPGFTREALQGAMVSLTLLIGIPCLRTRTPAETADLLRYAAQQARRHMSKAVHRHGYRPKTIRKRQLFLLQGLPGVGPARAERLMEKFGTVEAVFTADAGQIASVAGIGRSTAERIRLLATSRFAEEERNTPAEEGGRNETPSYFA